MKWNNNNNEKNFHNNYVNIFIAMKKFETAISYLICTYSTYTWSSIIFSHVAEHGSAEGVMVSLWT